MAETWQMGFEMTLLSISELKFWSSQNPRGDWGKKRVTCR
jgi:hypothetical protein